MNRLIFLIVFLLISCTNKSFVTKDNQQSAFIVFKTPKLKYADMGFIYKGNSFTKVEIYAMGQPIIKFDINGMNVCMTSLECMSKSDFNTKILNSSYPDDLLENIFRAEPIFNGKNLKETKNGFEQYIKDKNYNISYTLKSKEVIFRDTKNRILIKIKVKS